MKVSTYHSPGSEIRIVALVKMRCRGLRRSIPVKCGIDYVFAQRGVVCIHGRLNIKLLDAPFLRDLVGSLGNDPELQEIFPANRGRLRGRVGE